MLLALAQQSGPAPAEFGWWLASRASGIVALLCITLSVGIGLAMAGKIAARPLGARLMALHQQTALAGLVAIAVHGLTLLGDAHLSPSLGDIALPFTSTYAPVWTGLGVTAGWLAAILGLTYWLRDRIGPRRWRSLHKLTVLVYVLGVAHTLGAGTDAGRPWMLGMLVLTGAPVLFLFVMRVLTPRPAPAFRPFRVVALTHESATVLSLTLVPDDKRPIAPHLPGQFVPVRLDGLTRTYSLSAAPGGGRYRISVKREAGGAMSERLHERVAVGDVLELGRPAGRFVLDEQRARPVVLLSAGIGVTPVLAMLDALAAARSERSVWWIHGARCGSEHPFRDEVRARLARLPGGHAYVSYSRPDPWDEPGPTGRLTAATVVGLGVPLDADFHLCGTPSFVGDLTSGLLEAGVAPADITSESFGGGAPTPAPGVRAATATTATGPTSAIAFARSEVSTTWDGSFTSLLDLAEAHAVPNAASCRVGACHGCRATVLSGEVHHDPEPLAPPPAGSALLCCARPRGDLVLDA
jgi:ferredoxin-NADP reductase/DMSO/TMAO reductase YedYZ heme-binding membrane subunit